MTAFNRRELKAEWGTLTWELRSVNHRYLEVAPRLPENLKDLDNPVRELLRKRLSRGKVECTLRLKTNQATLETIHINQPLVRQLMKAVDTIGTLTKDTECFRVAEILAWPGVIETPEADYSEIQKAAIEELDLALNDFIAHREREGSGLKSMIETRLDGILEQVDVARKIMPELLKQQRQRILDRLDEITANPDQDRLEQEMVYIAQKADIDEELDRLTAHIDEVQRALKKGGPCGRRLDFLMQELNREANTLGSKSINASTTRISVELKVLIEQMREQIQNIE